jgi:hypothetical protein
VAKRPRPADDLAEVFDKLLSLNIEEGVLQTFADDQSLATYLTRRCGLPVSEDHARLFKSVMLKRYAASREHCRTHVCPSDYLPPRNIQAREMALAIRKAFARIGGPPQGGLESLPPHERAFYEFLQQYVGGPHEREVWTERITWTRPSCADKLVLQQAAAGEGMEWHEYMFRGALEELQKFVKRRGIPTPAEAPPEDNSHSDKVMSIEARAIAVLCDHHDWTIGQVAKAVGCSKRTLYRKPRFMEANAACQAGRMELPSGHTRDDPESDDPNDRFHDDP